MAEWPDLGADADELLLQLKYDTKTVKASLRSWREIIATSGGTGGLYSADRYQELAAYRAQWAELIAANAAELNAAYLRRKPALVSFDIVSLWQETDAGVLSFVDWFITNWPHKTGGAGHPAFRGIDAPTRQLTDLAINFNAAKKADMLAHLDAVIACLPTR